MPQGVKTFIGSVYGSIPLSIRFGKKYVEQKEMLDGYLAMDEKGKEEFTYKKVLETIKFAETHIPYYKNSFKEAGVSSADFKTLSDLSKFPVISKADIKANLDDFYIGDFEKPIEYYTGGSLSTPTKYYQPLYTSRAKEKAYNNYFFTKVDYNYRDKTLLLKGREVSKPDEDIYWEYEPIDNYFLISNNYMNSDKFPLIFEKAKEFSPKFLFGYPSALLSFIKQCKINGYEPLKIKAILLSSETAYPHEIKIIRDFFGVDVLTQYGHTERAAIAYRVNEEPYNFMNSYGAVRIINNEIVATGFDNQVMPLINYRTGDSVDGNIEYIEGTDIAKTCDIIEGRTQDFLVTDDNRLVSITTMCGGQHLPLDQISNIQYIQTEPGKVKVLVEDKDKVVDHQHVINGMKALVRDGVEFEVESVDDIPKSPRGKRVICKQSLDIEKIREGV
jgi:phenylacetate-CoA ligase